MNKGGIITIHDTDKDYAENFIEVEGHEDYDLSGPSEFIKTIDKRKFEVMNFFNYGIEKDFPKFIRINNSEEKMKRNNDHITMTRNHLPKYLKSSYDMSAL